MRKKYQKPFTAYWHKMKSPKYFNRRWRKSMGITPWHMLHSFSRFYKRLTK